VAVHGEVGQLLIGEPDRPLVCVRWRSVAPRFPDTLAHPRLPEPATEVLIATDRAAGAEAVAELESLLRPMTDGYSPAELDALVASMPLLNRFSTPDGQLEDWAVIFRDHYLEHSVGFLLALERAGVSPEWVLALAKGDQTHNRHRVHATFTGRGYTSAILDNAHIQSTRAHCDNLEAAETLRLVDDFIDRAHEDGRRVLAIDDGGLLARGYGAGNHRLDAALELTVSGLKRIANAPRLDIPVYNMARSQLKTRLGYPEIADSCLRRLRELVPDRKLIGRPTLLLGYGTLGARLASLLRALGCMVHVVDTDIHALIDAAEHGYPTHRTAHEALNTIRPALVAATTGELALDEHDLPLLPDGALLAPFATRDLLTEPSAELASQLETTELPGVGRCHQLPTGQTVTLLGDGRSLNLFRADSIPTRATTPTGPAPSSLPSTCAVTTATFRQESTSRQSTVPFDEAGVVRGLLRHLSRPHTTGQPSASGPGTGRHVDLLRQPRRNVRVRSRLRRRGPPARRDAHRPRHRRVRGRPKYQDLPRAHRTFPHSITELPDALAARIDLWSICCPTAEHLPVLTSILDRNPQARVLLEKPACQGHEIGVLRALLASNRGARIAVTDQYQHSRAVPALRELLREYEPDRELEQLTITFSKNRGPDIDRGRFIDRTYGVLGYEWLHMLTVLRQLLPPDTLDTYLRSDPRYAELLATYDPRLFVAALTERATLTVDGRPLQVELASTVTGSTLPVTSAPPRTPNWKRNRRPADDRHRHVTLRAGQTRCTLHLDPVTASGGWQLERNQHRLTVERRAQIVHDQVLDDSPLETALRSSIDDLLSPDPLPPPDLMPLQRIAAVAELLRAQQTGTLGSETTRRTPACCRRQMLYQPGERAPTTLITSLCCRQFNMPTPDGAAVSRPRGADGHLPLRLRCGHRPHRTVGRAQHPQERSRPGRVAPRTRNAAARPRAGGGGRNPSPRRPPPPAFHTGPFDMSQALDRVRDLVRAGFTGMLHRDEHGEIVAVQATRVRAGHIETVLIHDEHDALAARCRDEAHPAVVWHLTEQPVDVECVLGSDSAGRSREALGQLDRLRRNERGGTGHRDQEAASVVAVECDSPCLPPIRGRVRQPEPRS
jgi:hypothetical protein